MTTPTQKTLYKLVPATVADIDAIADISGDAFKDDTHTLLKAVWKGENHHRDGSKEDLAGLFDHPRFDITVAREGVDGTGDVIGSIIWAKRGYPEAGATKTDGNEDQNKVEQEKTVPTSTSATTLPPHPPPVLPAEPGSPLTIKELEETTNAAMTHYVDHLMPTGTKCRFIYGMNVSPAYQSQGIGSALMKWGTEKADEEGVICWVSSSMSGWPAYAKAGFVEVGRLELKLDDYAQGVRRKVKTEEGEEREEDWGTYIWRWMRRDPK